MVSDIGLEQTDYLKSRGFKLVDRPALDLPYLFLGPITGNFPGTELVFYHRLHNGNYAYNDHPRNTNSNPKDLVRIIENMTSRGSNSSYFFSKEGIKIPIVVEDPEWNPIVDLLMQKYNQK
ncbi:hypothetical protein HQ489_04030 [Candidatus Woesearchaeota archaeon]|nr:hypothetical protein [Candidatus Woesearchaeota archaeon]